MTVRAFAPGTIANLGPGLDILGLALKGPGDTVTVERHALTGSQLASFNAEYAGARFMQSHSDLFQQANDTNPKSTNGGSGSGFGNRSPYVGNSNTIRLSTSTGWNAGSTRDPGGDLVYPCCSLVD